jgi:DNA-binding NarL/FixJ family response regulator
MNKRVLNLTPDQEKFLKEFKQQGKRSLREINRANILLLLHRGKKAKEIVDFLDVGRNTVRVSRKNTIKNKKLK